MVEIYLLEQLVVVAKHGTLVSAAEALFGVSLFRRGNSKNTLNETGKITAEYAKHVLDADRDMVEKVRLLKGGAAR